MKNQIKIAIADDHGFVREGLVALLKRSSRIKVLFDVSNGQELLEKLKENKPDIILLDLEMPVLNGKEAFTRIKKLYPEIKIIIISAFFEEATVLYYVKRKVSSFLPKGYKVDKIIEAIEDVYLKGNYYNEEVSEILTKHINHVEEHTESLLTETEINIIKLICQHQASKEIALKLDLSKKTIDWYRDRIYKKTNSRNVTELVEYAIKHKIVKM